MAIQLLKTRSEFRIEMPKNIEKAMPGKNQVNISLSDGAGSEFELVANWLGMPKASLLRQKLEETHQSPAFASVVRRAKAAQKSKVKIQGMTAQLREQLQNNPEAIKMLDELEREIQALISGVPPSGA